MKTLTSIIREESNVKARLYGGECSYYRQQCEQKAIQQRELAFTLMKGSRSFQIAMAWCQNFWGVDLATRIGKVRLETRARGAPEFCFANGRFARLALGPPVNLGLSPLLHPKPQPCSTRNGREKIPTASFGFSSYFTTPVTSIFETSKSFFCFLTQFDGQNPCPKWLGCGGVPAGLTPLQGGKCGNVV